MAENFPWSVRSPCCERNDRKWFFSLPANDQDRALEGDICHLTPSVSVLGASLTGLETPARSSNAGRNSRICQRSSGVREFRLAFLPYDRCMRTFSTLQMLEPSA